LLHSTTNNYFRFQFQFCGKNYLDTHQAYEHLLIGLLGGLPPFFPFFRAAAF
jgi:hypothetical protein